MCYEGYRLTIHLRHQFIFYTSAAQNANYRFHLTAKDPEIKYYVAIWAVAQCKHKLKIIIAAAIEKAIF